MLYRQLQQVYQNVKRTFYVRQTRYVALSHICLKKTKQEHRFFSMYPRGYAGGHLGYLAPTRYNEYEIWSRQLVPIGPNSGENRPTSDAAKHSE